MVEKFANGWSITDAISELDSKESDEATAAVHVIVKKHSPIGVVLIAKGDETVKS